MSANIRQFAQRMSIVEKIGIYQKEILFNKANNI